MTMNFDTLSFARRLTEAGEKPAVAEAHALALKDFVMDRLATKDDLQLVKNELRSEISDVRKEIIDVRKDMATLGADLRKDIDVMGLKLSVRMGGMLVVAVGALATINKLF